jgi:agmatinase
MVDLETGDRLTPGTVLGDEPLVDVGDVSTYPSNTERTAASVEETLRALTGRGAVPIVLGGDHYITYPAVCGVVTGLADRHGISPEEVRLGYLQVDGHFDLASDNAIYGRHFHGAPARLVSELPAVGLGRMAWIGQRGLVRQEQWDYVRREDLRYYTPAEIRRRGPAEVAREALARVGEGVHGIYITIDIDIVDVTEAPGTGAISFGGLSAGEFLSLVAALRDERVVAIDLVEVAPDYDPSERTARLAATALLRFLMRPAGNGEGDGRIG